MKATKITWLLPIGTGLILLAGWWSLSHVVKVSPFQLPHPEAVFYALCDRGASLWASTRFTGLVALSGFFGAAIGGFLVALLLSWGSFLKHSLYPWVMILQMTPIMALAPILVIWLNSTWLGLIAITFLIGFFPVVANTAFGLMSVDKASRELFTMLGATRWQTMRYLRIPYAFPYYLAGLRIAATLAPIGAIMGEVFAGTPSANVTGLGFRIYIYHSRSQVPELFAAAFCACLLGFLFVGAVKFLNWLLLHKWHDSIPKSDV